MNKIKFFLTHIFPWVLGVIFIYYKIYIVEDNSFNWVVFISFMFFWWLFKYFNYVGKR